jgi:hypothetical protein
MKSSTSASSIISDPSAVQGLYNILLSIFSSQNIYSATINQASDSTGTYTPSYSMSLTATTTVTLNYTLIFISYSSSQSNLTSMVSALHSNVSRQLNHSVSSGQFTSMLAASTTSILTDMIANQVPVVPNAAVYYDQTSPSSSSSGSSNQGLSTAAIIGIVLGSLAFVMIAASVIVYVIYFSKVSSAARTKSAKDDVQMTTNPIARFRNSPKHVDTSNGGDSQASSPSTSPVVSPTPSPTASSKPIPPPKPNALKKAKSPKFANPRTANELI